MSTENISPTKINLIQIKKTLNLAVSGRDVLERKRDILLRELRSSIYEAEEARTNLTVALMKAYQALKEANMTVGTDTITNIAYGSNYEANFLVDYKSIMGVPVPVVSFQNEHDIKPDYGFANTSVELDKAFKQFHTILKLIADLAKAEGTAFQIANDVKKTQRQVNALNHVLIPKYQSIAKQITMVLEEKDREEFVRTKQTKSMIKRHVSSDLEL